MPPGGSAAGHDHAPGAAEQVAGDRRQQVVLAKLGDVEQGQHDVQPRLRAERLGDRDAAV
jgi:hypothetical protein